ncbi:MAG: peptidase M16 [Chloroflexota bacterium]|nr:peptidase M16 [Chloroflexota bacterium]NOG66189.1 peptidase M16 [Chloroflexota bacterium]GIK67675.1 MAG: peptidase M16 [Chloroflexota bacterium]
MTTQHGFELVKDTFIPELNSQARLYRHVQTGAELLSMENDDENKCFGITFRTLPEDSTGIAHILEHSVLDGSRKYPVKSPFVELLKGSLQTFVNAMTYPDKTVYPCASQNLRDFYNLVDVYMDTVFYPRFGPQTLQQEGWHFELENPDDPLTYKGVVFNEMKGAYSDADDLLRQRIQATMFPDNLYRLDSGGDPAVMPTLTFEQFKKFYDTHYHPSNSMIFFYGDDDPAERLRFTNDYLKDFQRLEIDSTIPLQKPFNAPKRLTYPYDAGEEANSMVTVNWLLPESANSEINMAMQVLTHILIGTPAAPLRKILIESGLGEDLAGSGLVNELRQMYFSTGLKGVLPENVGKVEALIAETLEALVKDGIDPDTVEASLNTIEFQLRELNTGSFPRGLALLIASLTSWVYHGDPLGPLAYEGPLNAIKNHFASNPRYFEGLIQQYLLKNSHRATVILEHDPDYRQRLEDDEVARLAKIKAGLNEADLKAIIENTRQLKLAQETPDTPEALAKIPVLHLSDIDRQNKIVPLEILEEQGSKVLYHDIFTNGITYLDVGFNLYALPQDYLPYVSLFGRALFEMGTATEDFVKLSQRIGRKTGGIDTATYTSVVQESNRSTAWLFLRGKSTVAQTDDLLAILRDVLLTVNLDNPERFLQMVLEEKAGQEAQVVPAGHIVVNTRLRAHFNEAAWANEQMSGVNYLFFLRDLAEKIEKDWPAVLKTLEDIRRLLVNRNAVICNVTLDSANWAKIRSSLNHFLSGLPAMQLKAQQWLRPKGGYHEGLTIPAQVNYVGKGANLYDLGYKLHSSVDVINRFLGTTWLWDKIRVQGGAYGGFSVFDFRSGVFTYISYRDPNLIGSLENYDSTGNFLRQLDLPQEEVTKAIIGIIGAMDTYQLPDAKGYNSMLRYLSGDSDEKRQVRREQVLSTTVADFKAFANVLDKVAEAGEVVVLGSQESIEQANESHDGFLKVTRVL